MANPEHHKILKRGVKAWNKWREEHPDVNPDLNEANLHGAYLTGANLIGAYLIKANLRGAKLEGAYLTGAKLEGAYLNQIALHVANLHGADLTRADLNGAYLVSAYLTEVDLTEANLTEATLISANLRRANLKGANLIWANLKGAYLNEANLRGADLNETYLRGADLRGADLTRASLYRTTMSSTRVAQADFTEAFLRSTVLTDLDLSEAIGLETVLHGGPSSIGVDTILQSKGEIPEVFLRGAGLPNDMILYSRNLRGNPIEFYSCFISYSHVDKAFARRLYDTLQGMGIRCWLDEHQLLPGDDFFEQIDRGIKLWDKVLLCCSAASLKSWWVDNEIKTAFDKEQKLMKKKKGKKVLTLIPLNLDGYLFKWKRGMAKEVKSRLAADFTGWEHDNSIFETQVERVVKALMTDDAGRAAPPPPRLK